MIDAKQVFIDTPELAKQYGERLGVTVNIPFAPELKLDAESQQEMLNSALFDVIRLIG